MSSEHANLEPIEPHRAQDLYLDHKTTDCVEATVQAHRYRTNHFVRWCAENDVTNLNDLTGRNLQEYRLWRQDDGDLKRITLKQQMSTIRVFLQWCASIEAVSPTLSEKVMVPTVGPAEERREETLDADSAGAILDYLSTYQYASRDHAAFSLLWETGIRSGAAYSLDVRDVDVDDQRINVVHRPATGTRLKNGRRGERPIAISDALAEMLDDYISTTRNDIQDDHGRNPLLSTTNGRMHRGTLRCLIYRVTAPCFRGEPCPDCTGTSERKCGEAVSPHSVRRGSITHFLTKDVPVEVVSDRMNVSRDVLDKHYDKRSEEVKLEQRRGYLDKV